MTNQARPLAAAPAAAVLPEAMAASAAQTLPAASAAPATAVLPAAPASPVTPLAPLSTLSTTAVPAWRLRLRQVAAIVRLELRKSFLGRRAIGLWLLALAPPAIFALRPFLPDSLRDPGAVGEATQIMAHAYQEFLLRVVIFLGCVWIFGNLIRREVLDRSLHFYFLAPVRRELLLIAKYLTGLAVSLVLFETSTVATFVFDYLPYDSRLRAQFLFHGPGLSHLGAYVLVTALACAGYGACFLAFGFFFRSPAIPALALFGWETIHFLLPPLLKQLSVIHYLQALCPVPLSEGPFALLSDAPSTAASIFGLLGLTAALVALSAWRIRRMEIAYLDD
jgi:ABC-type transport system involved in multi-copper enzyme maturation permease subunit